MALHVLVRWLIYLLAMCNAHALQHALGISWY